MPRRDIEEVHVAACPIERFGSVLPDGDVDRLSKTMSDLSELLGDRTLWSVSSTSAGGGVAEMLHVLLAYARGGEVDARWLVIRGPERFFEVTKRLHHLLHGRDPGGPIDDDAQQLYEQVSRDVCTDLVDLLRPGDVVMVHDPQPAGCIPIVKQTGARVIWRSHIGTERTNAHAAVGWRFLRPYVELADAFSFSRHAYAPEWAPADRTHIIPPSIDPFSPKNRELPDDHVRGILHRIGLLSQPPGHATPAFRRTDGSLSHVVRRAEVVQAAPITADTPLVTQISRWDPLKDMRGVMDAFVEHLEHPDAHLALVGPEVGGVSDDPEAVEVLDDCIDGWQALPERARRRMHLVSLPMVDLDENAAMVNAIQRHATVVAQKSLREGFGLTVAEAMWKATPVVASAVGGIVDQVVDGESGLLVDPPTDGPGFARAVDRLLADPGLADRMGRSAKERIRTRFLGNRQLEQYLPLLETVVP